MTRIRTNEVGKGTTEDTEITEGRLKNGHETQLSDDPVSHRFRTSS